MPVYTCKSIKRILCTLSLLSILSVYPAEAATLHFDNMYTGVTSQGLVLSNTLKSLDGREVTIQGFMAPPLKPTINFFVLTETPMSICPFCSTDADWPSNIVVVYLDDPVTALPYDRPITVTGRLSLGSRMDEETGFVSLVRIHADSIR